MTKTLTLVDTKIVMDFLILKKTETTTLDVKKKLRKMDFFATQKDVSNFMESIAEQNVGFYSIMDNGEYRTYSFNTIIDEDEEEAEDDEYDEYDESDDEEEEEEESDEDDIVVNFIPTVVEAEFIFYVASMVKAKHNDWVVFNVDGNCEYHIFNEDISRDRVRSKYASTNNIKIQKVRAKRFKNFTK